MTDQKKFLDYEGVKYLWSKINMQDYPNNETLMDVIEAIDETKADKSELFSGSWNDLTNKPFYDETIYYLSNDFETFVCDDNFGSPYDYFYTDNEKYFQTYNFLKEGITYYLTYRDADGWHDKSFVGADVGGNIGIGNLSIFNEPDDPYASVYPDTGESFAILYLINHEFAMIATKEPSEICITDFYYKELKQIDDKFISDNIARKSDLIKQIATDDEIIDMLIEEDMFAAVVDSDGAMLADENNNILLW